MSARLEGGPCDGLRFTFVSGHTVEAVSNLAPFCVATYHATDETRTRFVYSHSMRMDVLPPQRLIEPLRDGYLPIPGSDQHADREE